MSEMETRRESINIRALPAQKLLIDKASKVLKKSRSEFMLDSACREAQNVLLDQRLFILNDDKFQAFEEALKAPVPKQFKKLLSAKSPWEK